MQNRGRAAAEISTRNSCFQGWQGDAERRELLNHFLACFLPSFRRGHTARHLRFICFARDAVCAIVPVPQGITSGLEQRSPAMAAVARGTNPLRDGEHAMSGAVEEKEIPLLT